MNIDQILGDLIQARREHGATQRELMRLQKLRDAGEVAFYDYLYAIGRAFHLDNEEHDQDVINGCAIGAAINMIVNE